jgi:hypothetical protein
LQLGSYASPVPVHGGVKLLPVSSAPSLQQRGTLENSEGRRRLDAMNTSDVRQIVPLISHSVLGYNHAAAAVLTSTLLAQLLHRGQHVPAQPKSQCHIVSRALQLQG